jgi:hypothetical protein
MNPIFRVEKTFVSIKVIIPKKVEESVKLEQFVA